MNYGSKPIFKPEEMRAAFHPDSFVRQVLLMHVSLYMTEPTESSCCSRRMLSFSNIYAHNAWLLLSPSSLCCDWSLGSVPLVTSLTDTKNLYSVALYVSLAALVLRILLPKQNRYIVY